MTFLVKCDGCGKVQEADDRGNFPGNPVDDKTGSTWYSRVPQDEEKKKHKHACSRECMDGGLVFPF